MQAALSTRAVALPCVKAAATPSRRVRVVAVRAQQKDGVQEAVKAAALAGFASAHFLAAGSAQAAMEISQLAASDGRVGTLGVLVAVALGWVGFNIAGPASRQLEAMNAKKGVATGLGLGAAGLLLAPNADAATEAMQLAAGDGRLGLLGLLVTVALGWVAFQIAGPASRQLEAMNTKAGKKKSIAGAVGLGAASSLLLANNADAATEALQLAAGDGRLGLLGLLVTVALGWVAFQIAGPASRQLEAMNTKAGKKKSIAGAVSLGAASSLLLADNADATTEAMQLATSDNRAGLLALLVSVALGWVSFQIFGPASRQLAAMNEKAATKKK